MYRSKLLKVLSIILIVMSLVLCLADPVIGVIGIAFGIVLLILEKHGKDRNKEQASTQSVKAEPTSPATVHIVTKPVQTKPDGIPSRKHVLTRTTKVAGVTFKCEKDHDMSRQEILSDMSDGDIVTVEKYEYKGAPAYLLIDDRTGYDIGNIPADLSEKIGTDYPDNDIEAYVVDIDSFSKDDDDSDEEIYTCKIKLFVLE